MEPERRKPTGREKDEAAVKLLEKLREQLQSSDASSRRRAAFNLSWLQEDGLEILRGALFGSFPVTTKNAAAYGLRKMRGRMKKMAVDVLKQGLKSRDALAREVSRSALQLLGEEVPGKPAPRRQTAKGLRIREITRKGGPRRQIDIRRTRR
jgi:HEAT repeat protein